ncbi:patatin-like protein [Rhodocista pekingensis]|uniref:Patatin-like protein n=1 Tax=Rhodocista pekingensis TaxID=201185 RepID=A0ABW2KXU8_9PROT
MKEKELRIALVCYGGVSLAVYMHGVTKELLALVKASQRRHAPGSGSPGTGGPPAGSGAVYRDLLDRIGRRLDLRVVVDAVAGSSAGGINGVFLARGLAHDLPLDPLTDLWLENADVTRLLAPDRRARAWSKWFLRPLLWLALGRSRSLAPDAEARGKLSLFVRSRWFQPPFSGDRLLEMLLEAACAMGRPATPAASLLPPGMPLSLLVTVTDFHGFRQTIAAHDPPLIEEREHRRLFRFEYRRPAEGEGVTDFDLDSVPGLAFAARATASFPGAFPPAQLPQLDRALAAAGLDWPARARFLEACFPAPEAGGDPAQASLIDGSVLNNKPFAAALAAIAGRPAFREVDRRIVYVDPNPAPPGDNGRRGPPGFFRTLKGALSDIPRNEPVRDELAAIAERNARVARLRGVLEGARPRVEALVARVLGGTPPEAPTYAQMRAWRDAAGSLAAADAGFAYEAYLRLKIGRVLDGLAALLARLAGLEHDGEAVPRLRRALDAWAAARGISADATGDGAAGGGSDAAGAEPPWVGFLRDFDVEFRRRRLRFVVREVNRLYGLAGDGGFAETRPQDLDELKSALYGTLEGLHALAEGLPLGPEERALAARAVVAANGPPDPDLLDRVLRAVAAALDLEGQSRRTDELFCLMGLNYLGAAARAELFTAYVGFAFWDVLAFATSGWRELEEFHEIKVDRIGPPDARLLRAAGAPLRLQGARLNSFGAFFSRYDREHDYLLGRLHAAERAIDLLADAAGPGVLDAGTVAAAKHRAFRAVLESERCRLGRRVLALAEGWVAGCRPD